MGPRLRIPPAPEPSPLRTRFLDQIAAALDQWRSTRQASRRSSVIGRPYLVICWRHIAAMPTGVFNSNRFFRRLGLCDIGLFCVGNSIVGRLMGKFGIKRLAFDFVANGRDTVGSSIPTSVAIDLLDRSGLRCKISLASFFCWSFVKCHRCKSMLTTKAIGSSPSSS